MLLQYGTPEREITMERLDKQSRRSKIPDNRASFYEFWPASEHQRQLFSE